MRPSPEIVVAAADALSVLAERRPRVHAITNPAAATLTANALLALGALPSLTTAVDEVAAFAGSADALLVNLGSLDGDRRGAIRIAVVAATELGRPWVLDPVLIDRSPSRRDFAAKLTADAPAIVKANAAEAALLDVPAGVLPVVTGPVDRVGTGATAFAIANGHPLMARVTGMGCALGAVMAAVAAVAPAPVAAAAALLAVGIAGERAGEASSGPGGFVPAFLDALYRLDRSAILERARFA